MIERTKEILVNIKISTRDEVLQFDIFVGKIKAYFLWTLQTLRTPKPVLTIGKLKTLGKVILILVRILKERLT